jgi:hypothetical protein
MIDQIETESLVALTELILDGFNAAWELPGYEPAYRYIAAVAAAGQLGRLIAASAAAGQFGRLIAVTDAADAGKLDRLIAASATTDQLGRLIVAASDAWQLWQLLMA